MSNLKDKIDNYWPKTALYMRITTILGAFILVIASFLLGIEPFNYIVIDEHGLGSLKLGELAYILFIPAILIWGGWLCIRLWNTSSAIKATQFHKTDQQLQNTLLTMQSFWQNVFLLVAIFLGVSILGILLIFFN